MKEVSCRIFDTLLRDLRERGVEPQLLVEGTPYSPKHIADKDERVDWSAFLRMMQNASGIWTREQLIRLGERSTEGPLVQFIGVVARIRFSVGGFYQWVFAPGGVASQMITCATCSSHVEGPGRIRVEFKMSPGYAPSTELFLISQGTYAAMPTMMGAAPAKVRLELVPDGGIYEIQFTESRGVLPAIRRFVTAPFNLRDAAHELQDAHTSLLARYNELDTARGQVESQRELLDVAYQLGQQIWSERDLQKIGNAVTTTLLARRGVVGVRLSIAAFADIIVERGQRTGAPGAAVELASNKGRLEAWSGENDPECQRLLDLVAPTIALAIDNAVAYHDLAEYQVGLEQLVDQRTTELRSARDELSGLVEQLKDAQASREKFFGNISHEIRTPLSLILLSTGDIERRAGAALDRRSIESLGAVTEGARKLLRLVDELLLLAAGQADKLVLSPEPTDLVALCSQLLSAWRPAAEAAGLRLELRQPSALIANVDPVAFERVASNLLSNAVKYTPKGGRIDLAIAFDADGIHFSVSDTGPGIDPDLARRLFGRFERASGQEQRKSGTGIGLALVKQLVEAHGGTASVRPRPEGGTEFRVDLPRSLVITEAVSLAPTVLRTTHAPAALPTTITSGQMFVPSGLSAGTILIAEDEPRLAQSIARLLGERYTVVVALDGMTAVELLRRHQPQLLITDVDMPGMSGIELAKQFRELAGDRLAPIIILSAVLDLGTRLAGLEAGAVDYVGKPFEPKELQARVDAQFRMRDLALRLHRAEQLSALGILTSGLAHELRNPANGIVNALDPLRELLPPELLEPNSAVAELFEAMKASADQMWFLVNQLLGFRSNAALELRSVELPDLVRRAVRLASGALQGVTVRLELANAGAVMCAPPLMVQVLTNLVENAGDAAGTGGWVEIRTDLHKEGITIEITDSGPGVPVELRERIFEPFFTTKDPKPGTGGTGLGLSVARTIVHRHQGTLEVRSRGDRTAFVIELPANSDLVRAVSAV